MACIVPAQYITRILNQRMLEPAAGAEKGDAILTRVTRRNKRRLGVFIRACRYQPDGIVPDEVFGAGQLRRGEPVIISGEIQNRSGVVNRQRDRLVRNNIGIVITNQRNAQRRFNRGEFHQRFLMPEDFQIT
ncbi:Uncharacterised protein [Enterobacter cloacae]|nr:Uncharacterised protein [Enterobacter cloacae]